MEYKHLQLYGTDINGNLGGKIIKIEKVGDTPDHLTENIYDVIIEVESPLVPRTGVWIDPLMINEIENIATSGIKNEEQIINQFNPTKFNPSVFFNTILTLCNIAKNGGEIPKKYENEED